MATRKQATVAELRADNTSLRRGLKDARSELTSTQKTVAIFEKRLIKANKEVDRQRALLNRQQRALQRARSQYAGLSGTLGGLSSRLLVMTGGIYGVNRAFQRGYQFALRWDRQMVTVAKTTGLADAEIQKVKNSLIEISNIEGISRDELGIAAGIAGQLGIGDTASITEFTRVIAQMERATDLTAANASAQLARILNLTGEDVQQNISKLSDAIVNLGNNYAVLESRISATSVQLAAELGRFGVASEDVAAFAAAVGIAEGQDESASTAMSRLLTRITQLADKGGPKFKKLAQEMGKDSERLRDDLKNNFTDTIVELLALLREFDAASQNRLLIELLDFESVRETRQLLKIAPNIPNLLRDARDSEGAREEENRRRLLSLSGRQDVAFTSLDNAFGGFADVILEEAVPAIEAFARAANRTAVGLGILAEHFNQDDAELKSLLQHRRDAQGQNSTTPAYLKKAIESVIDPRGLDPTTGLRPNPARVEDVLRLIGLHEQEQLLKTVQQRQLDNFYGSENLADGVRKDLELIRDMTHRGSGTLNAFGAILTEDNLAEFVEQTLLDMGRERGELLAGLFPGRSGPDQKPIVYSNPFGGLGSGGGVGPTPGRREFVSIVPEADIKAQYDTETLNLLAAMGAFGRTDGAAFKRLRDLQSQSASTTRLFDGKEISQAQHDFIQAQVRAQREAVLSQINADAGDNAFAMYAQRMEEERQAALLEAQMGGNLRSLYEQEQTERIRKDILIREAADERKLLAHQRAGASDDLVAYYEDLLRIKREHENNLLQFQLDNDRAAFELRKAQLERQLESLERPEEDERTQLEKDNQELGDRIAGTIADAIRSDSSISDAWKGLMNELANELLDQHIMEPFKKSLSALISGVLNEILAGQSAGGVGGILSGIGGLFGFGRGGGTGGPAGGPIPGAFRGGDIRRGGLAIVGERGPELVNMPRAARITPLDGTAAIGGGFTQNINIVSEDSVAIRRVLREEMPKYNKQFQADIINKSRGNTQIARALKS